MAMTNDANKMVAMVLGAVLVLIGILGFVPALVPGGLLLGILGVNALHNVIHLLTGAILLGAAYMNEGRNARLTNMVLGGVYLLVALVGFAAPGFMNGLVASQEVAMNPASIIHLLLGVVLLGVAFMQRTEAGGPTMRQGV